MMFLPTTREELQSLGWKTLDIILITGDAYIDSSYIGVAVIGRVLADAGYRVGVIAQPDIHSDSDIRRLGEPELFWGVTSGCVDSMISNYTPTRKPRNKDDLTPGGMDTVRRRSPDTLRPGSPDTLRLSLPKSKRPDRAVIVYTNVIKRCFKHTKPIVLGGIEASLRRISHYDYWSDSVKRSVLFDAKADVLVYGMGEKTVLELAAKLRNHQEIKDIRGLCYISANLPDSNSESEKDCIELPPHETVCRDKKKFIEMFQLFYENTDPFTAKPLCQKQDTRWLIQNPPQFPPSTQELDSYYELPYKRDVHPFYKKDGEVRALETLKFSITTHRGCYGECRFCAITVHQGRTVTERSEASVLREAALITQSPDFKGYIHDVGGPTANMYGMECEKKKTQGACQHRHCLFPSPCKHLPINHSRQLRLLRQLRNLPKIKKVFIASGIRHDLVLHDKAFGPAYLEEVVRHHVSGQMKIAPEHCEDRILNLMGKPGAAALRKFKAHFDRLNRKFGKQQFLTYYFMAAHPGCTFDDMSALKKFAQQELRLYPEQVQIFTPSPSTFSTLMYYTEIDPFSGLSLFAEKDNNKKEKQKNLLKAKKLRIEN